MNTDSGKMISLTFEASPLPVALSAISAECGVAIVWSKDIDDTLISGVFEEEEVGVLLLAIAKRYDLQLADLGGLYFLGTGNSSDRISIVLRSPSTEVEVVKAALISCLSDFGKVDFVGSSLIVSDYFYNVKRIVEVVQKLRDDSLRAYIAEVYFLRMKDSDLLDLQARLRVKDVDIFSCTFNIKTLFSAYLDVTGSMVRSRVDNRPILYLTEGRKSVLEVGSEVVRSEYSVSAEGYSTTSGYKTFSDGVRLELTPYRINTDVISLDVSLSVSEFIESETLKDDTIPTIKKSVIESPGILLKDGEVFFVGSLRISQTVKGGQLFGISGNRSDEIVTVWIQVRELGLNPSS